MHKFSPSNAHRLEHDDRYALIPPSETLKRLGLGKDMTVADIGAGTGFFTRAASDIVGEKGKVYALDMSEEMLEYLKEKGVSPNVEVLLSGEYRLPLPDESVDFAFVAFVLHETPDRNGFLQEIQRVMRKSGRIAIVEWKKHEEEHGLPASERLDQVELESELPKAQILDHGSLNSSHYFLLLKK